MLNQQPRSYSEYNRLKEESFLEVNKEDAPIIVNDLKNKLLTELKSLNVNNINEIENFYLHAVKLIHCLSFICAKNKSKNKNIEFEDALNTISTDEILNSLINIFKKEMDQIYFYKIKEIDSKYAPAKQSWAGIHARFLILYGQLKVKKNFQLVSLIEKSIISLEHEENSFRNSGNTKLAELVKKLREGIRISTKKYLINQDKQNFRNNINDSLSNANQITEEHGLKKLIDSIAKMIIGFFFKDLPSDFSFFNNPIKENIKELQVSLNYEHCEKNIYN